MLDALETLNSDVVRRISAWERNVVTTTETVGFLIDRFSFAVLDFPNDRSTVSTALNAVPNALISSMIERMAGARIVGDGWLWPLAGTGIATPGGVAAQTQAGPRESEAADVLSGWLHTRIEASTTNRE